MKNLYYVTLQGGYKLNDEIGVYVVADSYDAAKTRTQDFDKNYYGYIVETITLVASDKNYGSKSLILFQHGLPLE